MKIIDLLTEFANGKKFENCKIKIKGIEPEEFSEYFIYDRLYEEDVTLNDEIEIIEEVEDKEYEDIEEIGNLKYCENEVESILHRKIDTLIRNQKYILGVLNDNNKNNR